jgi:hypothetical protein
MEEQARPKAEPFKLKKFQQIPSKVVLGAAASSSSSGVTIEPAESPSKQLFRPSTAGRARSNTGLQVAFGRTT